MMLFKLSVRNIRKSMQNYLIYFATLILGVAIFYIFNALDSQTVMLQVSQDTREIIDYMMGAMSVVSVFVSVVLGFLVVYASSFLMKRRKKEFGIYLVLGMKKAQVAKILMLETILIGLCSLVVGLLLGIAVSQGMSVIVANMFEANVTQFQFTMSEQAIGKTILYFAVMYGIVMVLDVFVVGRAKLIHLLHAGQKKQKNHAKNPIFCTLVFIGASVMLGSAYYHVTAGINEIKEFADIGMQIGKGIFATFLIFWSVSGLLLTIAKRIKRFYYNGINSFSVKELANRINTTVFSGSIICLLLFFTICILSSAMAIKNAMNETLKNCAPVDIQFEKLYGTEAAEDFSVSGETVRENLIRIGMDLSKLTDESEMTVYQNHEICDADVLGNSIDTSGYDAWYIDYLKQTELDTVHLSDYNRFVSSYGGTPVTLAENEYAIVCNYSQMEAVYNAGLRENAVLDIKGKNYYPKQKTCIQGIIHISNSESNGGVLLVPDAVDLSDSTFYIKIYSANYNANTEDEREACSAYYTDEKLKTLEQKFLEKTPQLRDSYYFVSMETKAYLYETSIGMTVMIVFIGIYLGIVFLISGAAILALKELSEAADNKEKYRILRRIGVDEKQIHRSLLAQSGAFFGMPLVLAVIHSIFGMQTALYILTVFGRGGLLGSILLSAAIILIIYGIYFWITYACSKRIIAE